MLWILAENYQFFSTVSNVDLENLNLSITTNIRDILTPLIQQVREIRDFLNLHAGPKTKPNDDLSDIICHKDLFKENAFLRGEVEDLSLLNHFNQR